MNPDESCKNWPHHWFGYFRTNSPTHAKNVPTIPPVTDFIDPNWNYARKAEVIKYLEACFYVGAPMIPTHTKCMLCDKLISSANHHWDGEWLWPVNLSHDVEAHQVRIPDRMLRHLEDRNFQPPVEVPSTPHEQLPWPPVPKNGSLLDRLKAFFSQLH